MELIQLYQITYYNLRRREKSPLITLETAKAMVDFLKFQGAKRIKMETCGKAEGREINEGGYYKNY
jgi:hypothetical protein